MDESAETVPSWVYSCRIILHPKIGVRELCVKCRESGQSLTLYNMEQLRIEQNQISIEHITPLVCSRTLGKSKTNPKSKTPMVFLILSYKKNDIKAQRSTVYKKLIS